MIYDNQLVIERINGGIKIKFDSIVERYLGYSLKDAERKFRNEHGLKGKKLEKIMI